MPWAHNCDKVCFVQCLAGDIGLPNGRENSPLRMFRASVGEKTTVVLFGCCAQLGQFMLAIKRAAAPLISHMNLVPMSMIGDHSGLT
jgi:hypothetical protein